MTVFVLKRQKKRNYTSCYPMLLKNQRHSFRPVGESPLLQFITLKSLDLRVRKIVHIVYRSLFLLSSEATIIPGTVTARLSLRIVPDQDLDTIVRSLRDYIQTSFNVLQSTNGLKVNPFIIKNNLSLFSLIRLTLITRRTGGLETLMIIGSNGWKAQFRRNGA